ncbi:MAG: hypothetical protein U0360_03935 [Dehalococcoidia bacterium]
MVEPVKALLAGALAAGVTVAGIATFVLVQSDPVTKAGACASGERLRAAGFSDLLVEVACTTTTEYLDTDNGRYHYVQRAPALKLQRDLIVSVRADREYDVRGARMISAAGGDVLYPLLVDVRPFDGGYHLVQSFFLPYEGMRPETREGLGLNRRGGVPPSDHLIASRIEPTFIRGVQVSSVSTTTSAGSSAPDPHAAVTILDGTEDTILEDFIEPSPEARAWLESAEVKEYNRRTNEMLMEQGRHPNAEWARAEAMAADVERELAAEAERKLAESSQRATSRFGAALAGLQAIGEWMQQALDFFENDAALQAAEDCLNNPTNPVAQNAQKNDPTNYNRAREQIHEARSENSWDTGVRVLNTANGAASSAIPGAAGMAIGVASGGSNATLRQLQQQRTQQAVAGVTPCDTSTGGGGSSASSKGGTAGTGSTPPTGTPSATSTASSTAQTGQGNPTPGPSRIITPTPIVPRKPNTAVIRVDELHKWDGLDHHIQYSAVVDDLTNLIVVRDRSGAPVKDASGKDITVPDMRFTGTGSGSYDEQGTVTDSEGRTCTVSLRGFVPVTVRVEVETRAEAGSGSAIILRSESGFSPCFANTPDGREVSIACQFYDVDLENGGHYIGGEWENGTRIDGPDQPGYYERCYLDLGPLRWHDGRPVKGPRNDFVPLATAVARP